MALVLQSLDIKDSICSWWIPLFSQYYNETLPGGGELQYLYKLRSLIPLQPVKKGTNVFSTTIAALTE